MWFVKIIRSCKALVFILVWLCLADVMFSSQHILILSLIDLMFVYYRGKTRLLRGSSLFFVLFEGSLPQKFVRILFDGH